MRRHAFRRFCARVRGEEVSVERFEHERRLGRCDGCDEPAAFQVVLPSGSEVLLCRVHDEQHRERLVSLGCAVTPMLGV